MFGVATGSMQAGSEPLWVPSLFLDVDCLLETSDKRGFQEFSWHILAYFGLGSLVGIVAPGLGCRATV